MLTRTKLKNLIYSKTTKLTSSKYHDDSWQGVSMIKKAINDIIKENGGGYQCFITVHDGGYHTSSDGMSKWKEYWVDIFSNNADHPVICGTLNCHAAGTVEDPFKSYDMSLVIWLNNSNNA